MSGEGCAACACEELAGGDAFTMGLVAGIAAGSSAENIERARSLLCDRHGAVGDAMVDTISAALQLRAAGAVGS